MSEMTEACVRGCTLYRRHLSECEGIVDETCRGCLPRRAQHGRLCWPCHRRFELMLHDAPTVYRWLTGNMASGQSVDPEKPFITGSPTEVPAPIRVGIMDARDLLADQLACWVDDLCEHSGLMGPGGHSVASDAKFLRTWLSTVERLEWVGDWWEELAETMSSAHALAPWRPVMRRVGSIPCPECAEVNLAIFGGESDVTCLSCRTLIPERAFGLWEQIVKDEYGIGVAG